MGVVASHSPEHAKSSQTDLSKTSQQDGQQKQNLLEAIQSIAQPGFSSCPFIGTCKFLEDKGQPNCRAPDLGKLWVILSSHPLSPLPEDEAEDLGGQVTSPPAHSPAVTEAGLGAFYLFPRSGVLSTNLCPPHIWQGPTTYQVHAVERTPGVPAHKQPLF